MTESGEWDRGVDEETRKDDRLMERKYKGRAEEKMMLGADGQRAGGKSYWWLLHLRSASESYKHSIAECSTQPYHCSTAPLSVCSCMCVHQTDAASIYGTVFVELPTKALVSYATTDRMFSMVKEITPFDDVHLHFKKGMYY